MARLYARNRVRELTLLIVTLLRFIAEESSELRTETETPKGSV
jgi:hypothetical protein